MRGGPQSAAPEAQRSAPSAAATTPPDSPADKENMRLAGAAAPQAPVAATPAKARVPSAISPAKAQGMAPFTPSRGANPFATPRKPTAGMPLATPRTGTRAPMTPAPAAQPQRRLIIHKMVLENFKSYAGRQVIGPFHKSFSSVVGPNGSGKSNVIDSLLFVFGWRANKMRQGRLSELIHNSDGSQEAGSCTVEVWFHDIVDLPGSDDYSVVPHSTLVIARTAFRNNQSQYTINGQRSNYTEVTTLLRGRGIDLDHKRFLILQGEVESIAQMPPKGKTEHDEGLLEYLEDIIGTSGYQEPIEQHARAVDEASESRAEKLQRLKIVQRELENLEPRRREALQYLRDHNELTRQRSALWQLHMHESRVHIADTTQRIDALRAQIDAEMQKHADATERTEALRAEHDAALREFDAVSAQVSAATRELEQAEKEIVQLEARRKLLDGKRKKLSKSTTDDRHAASAARATAQNASEELAHLREELTEHESALAREESALEAICERLKSKTQSFSAAIDAKQQELAPWGAKISDCTAARDVAQEERDLLASREEEASHHAEDAAAALEQLRLSLEEKQEEESRLRAERAEIEERNAEDEGRLAEMQRHEAQLAARAQATRRQADEARQAAAANRSRGDVQSSLLRQAELGLLTGFHGRLGNLGAIDDRYDVAISTACPGLNNLVVESVETGQQCIEHLRKHRLGRANFILLNSLEIKPALMQPIKTPEGVPRLFDLVRPKHERFAPAFYHQLRDTLVARDLEQANRIAYAGKRWRVVTEEGQLIDKSGTMSGGGNKVFRGAMGSSLGGADVTPEHAAKLEKEHQLAEEELRSHRKSLAQFTELYEQAQERVPQIDRRLAMLEMDLGTGAERVREEELRVEELRSRRGVDAADAERIRELDAQLAQHASTLEELQGHSATIEAEINALQEQILEAGGVELRAQKSKVEGIRGMMELNGERMAKAEVAKAKAEKDTTKHESAHAAGEEQLQALEAELAELAATTTGKTQATEELRRRLDEANDALEDQAEKRNTAKAQLDEHAESLNAFRKLEMEVKQKLEDCSRSISDHEKRLHHWEEKHAQLCLYDIPESEEPSPRVEQGAFKPEPDAEAGEEPAERHGKALSEDDAETDSPEGERGPESEGGDTTLRTLGEEELASVDKDAAKSLIAELEERLNKGHSNLAVLDEYRQREEELISRARDLEQTTQSRDEAQQRYEQLRKERLERFMDGFNQISLKLKEMYQTITLGGNAELELVDSLDPFSEGIIFSVMPPKKSWKNISNLSGGEKTLSSLALVFALHVYKPTPLYVMDEIDAALDFRNVSIIANLIKERTRGAQFVIISLRNNMFELSSRLVGVYKTANATKSLTIDNTDLHAKSQPPATPGVRASPSKPGLVSPSKPSLISPSKAANAPMMPTTPSVS